MVSDHRRLLIAWNVGGALVICIPLLAFWGSRISETFNNGNEDNNEDVNFICSWWKLWCWNGEVANNDASQEDVSPWWWVFGNDQQGPDRQGGGGVVIVYGWSVFLFVILNWIGCQMIKGSSDPPDASITTIMRGQSLRMSLLAYANMAFVCVILVASNVEVDARAIQELGWYGQLPVLMVLTCLFAFVHCLVFLFVFRNMGRDNGNKSTSDRETELTTGYHLDTSTGAAAGPTITESTREVDGGNPDQPVSENHKHKQGGWFDMPAWLS